MHHQQADFGRRRFGAQPQPGPADQPRPSDTAHAERGRVSTDMIASSSSAL